MVFSRSLFIFSILGFFQNSLQTAESFSGKREQKHYTNEAELEEASHSSRGNPSLKENSDKTIIELLPPSPSKEQIEIFSKAWADVKAAFFKEQQNYHCLVAKSEESSSSPKKDLSFKKSSQRLIIDLIQKPASEADRDLFLKNWPFEDMMAALSEENSYENEDLMCGRASIGKSRSRSELIGMVLYKSQNKGDQLYIDSLCIAENHQRCGYASSLIDHLTKAYNPKEIRALISDAGRPFFKGIGFKKDPEDDGYMLKSVKIKKAASQKRKWAL